MHATQEPRDLLGEAAALARAASVGTLATVREGRPHAAFVTPALGADAAPLLLLSTLAVHTRQLGEHPFCALLLTGGMTADQPQATPRLCLSGRAGITDDPAARARYLARHPSAARYAGFADFAIWRLEVAEILYIGGFAAAAALEPAALRHRIMNEDSLF